MDQGSRPEDHASPTCNPHVVLIRRKWGPPPVPAIGYEIFVPNFDAPTVVLDDVDDLPAALGWNTCIPVGARHARIDGVATWGMVRPSVWEQAFVAWVAVQLGAPILDPILATDEPRETAHGQAPPRWDDLRDRLRTLRPWASGDEVPAAVTVHRAATRRGEARAVARACRSWLVARLGPAITDPRRAAEACSGVLVLVPDDPDRLDRLGIELDRVDLPVRSHRRTSLVQTGLGRWALALAELAGWSAEHPRRADLIEEVTLAPFIAFGAVTFGIAEFPTDERPKPRRRHLRGLIRGLRRPEVTTTQWREHSDAAVARAQARADSRSASERGVTPVTRASAEFVLAIAERLAPGPFLLRRLRRLLDELHTAAAIRAIPDGPARDLSLAALARLLEALSRLEQEEQAQAGDHPRLCDPDHGVTLAQLLRETLGSAALVTHREPELGVTILPYSGYDGRATELLVLVGLEEGGYPQVPRRPSQREATWLDRLGVLAGAPDQTLDERVDATVLVEIERQIELAGAAMAQTRSALILAFANEGADGRATHPGALLSLLLGGWDEAMWDAAPPDRVQTTTRADEVPPAAARVHSWFELGYYPDALPDPVGDANSRPSDPSRAAVARLQARRASLVGSRALQREHAPLPPGQPGAAACGPYTGRLPGRLITLGKYSATALEQFNGCAYRYFLRHVLGVRPGETTTATLSPMEQGNLVHDSLAAVVQRSLAALPGTTFDFVAPQAQRDARIGEIVELVAAQLGTEAARLIESEPTLSAALVHALVDRWRLACRHWLEATLQAQEEVELDSAAVEAAPEVEAATLLHRKLEAKRDAVDTFDRAVSTGSLTSKAAWSRTARELGLNGAAAGRAFAVWTSTELSDAGLIDAIAAFRAASDYDRQLGEAAAAIDRAITCELARRQRAFARRQRYAELGFGGVALEGLDAASVEGALELPIGETRRITVRGSVDRVDLDTDRGAFAVLDYKTSKLPDQPFGDRLVAGIALQPTIYAMALRELARAGRITALAGVEPRVVGYLYPKVGREDVLDPSAGSGWRLADPDATRPELSWFEITRVWIEHATDAIAAGRFDMIPVTCPKLPGPRHYCDVEHACRIQADHQPNFQAPDRPSFSELASRSSARGHAGKPAPLLPPNSDDAHATTANPDPATEHERAMQVAADPSRDVVISAGAGTGKTYSLVLRYLRILATGVLPSRILCATFTRRAAAEMVHRIRQALLGRPTGPLADVVASLATDPARIRRIVLTLSCAPITTIDSMGFRLLTEARDAKAELAHEPPPAPVRVLEPAAAANDLDEFVTARALAALDRGDADMLGLIRELPPERLLEHLRSAVEQAGLESSAEQQRDPSPTDVAARWWELADVVAQPIVAYLRSLDHDAIADIVADAELDLLDDDARARLERALAAVRALGHPPQADTAALGPAQTWDQLAALADIPQTQALIPGSTSRGPNRRIYELAKHQLGDLPACAGLTPEARAGFVGWSEQFGSIERLAGIAAQAASLSRRWQREFAESLDRRGVLRYGDVEQQLLGLLECPQVRDALAARVPVEHILVDESQDTSQRQVDILGQVVAMHGARSFWVGDPKQSIYRFRGAEVDVFVDRCEHATERGAVPAHLTVNRRSQAPILEAVNALFGPLFPAQRDRVALDPRSGTTEYVPLVAPDSNGEPPNQAGEPLVELIVGPSPGWRFDDPELDAEATPAPPPESALDVMTPTDSELAAVQRIVEVLHDELGSATAPSLHGPVVAVLASSWGFVARFRRLLAAVGVEAAVEGGRGLLATLEARALTDWLVFAVDPNDLHRLAVLRGPGIGLSDAGLYLLRTLPTGSDGATLRWFELDDADGPTLDPEAAVARWTEHDPSVDPTALAELLTRDAAAIQRFRATSTWLRRALGHQPCAELLTELAERLGLWALWRDLGRQAVANAEATLELVRTTEASLGVSPRRLVRHLDAIRDHSDPPADGIEADAGAAVVITTIWQAKGREWPVVVLPEMQRVKARSNHAGLGTVRLVRGCDDDRPRDAVRVPDIRYSSPSSPFATESSAVTELIKLYQAPQDRAELRRLLYVAMTRPKRRLILTATLTPPSGKLLPASAVARMPSVDAEQFPSGAFTLCQAKDWAKLIQVATALTFEGPDHPRFGDGSVWTDRHVRLISARSVAARLVTRAPAPSEQADRVDLATLGPRLMPITAPGRVRINPSALAPLAHEPRYERLGGGAKAHGPSPFPSPAIEGTAVHAVMEHWCFGANGARLDAAFVHELLTELELLTPGPDGAAQVARVLEIWAENQATLPGVVAEFERAAARGEVLHEVPVRAQGPDGMVEGRIDLLWREADAWTVVDYKNVEIVEIERDDEPLRKHAAQVELYADLVGAPRRAVWYLRAGELVRW